MVRLAIITICYNDRAGLERTFASVLAQGVPDIEYIVVDGGSTDGSVDVIRAHAQHLAHWVSEPDGGIYQAMNKGWQLASAPFVLFMNAGDEFAGPEVLQYCLQQLTEKVDVLYGDALLGNGNAVYGTKAHPRRMHSAWLMKESVAHQSQFIRRTMLQQTGGYDLRFPIAADYALFARLFWKEHAQVMHAGCTVCTFHTTGLSSDPARKQQAAQERKSIQQAFAPFFWYHLYHGWAAVNRWIGR